MRRCEILLVYALKAGRKGNLIIGQFPLYFHTKRIELLLSNYYANTGFYWINLLFLKGLACLHLQGNGEEPMMGALLLCKKILIMRMDRSALFPAR